MPYTSELHPTSKEAAGLYIVATPIGNMKDITLRALEVLKQADYIACEDTRTTQKLLSYYGIHTKMIAYHDHTTPQARENIMKLMENGKAVALVSDAGTPLVSDPGYKLVRLAQEKGLKVTTLPGASSFLAALTLSGLPSNRFLFEGFLPPRQEGRKKALLALKPIPATLVFFESARRLPETLEDMAEAFGPHREASVSREITKLYEETKRSALGELCSYYQENGAPKGEVVIVVAPPPEEIIDAETLDNALNRALTEMSIKDAAGYIATQTGLPKKLVYTRALELKGQR